MFKQKYSSRRISNQFNMKKNAILLLLILSVSCSTDIYRHLKNGYYYVSLGGQNVIISQESSEKEMVVPCMIVSYEHDEEYLIVVNENVKNCAWEVDNSQRLDQKYQYWIIQMEKELIYGPMTQQEFLLKRKELKVSSKLELAEKFR